MTGYNLYSIETKVIKAFGNDLVKTDIGISIPEGTYGRLAPRSGSIYVGAGVIDSGFRGKSSVALFNHPSNSYHIQIDHRIAQLILEKPK